MLSKTSHPNRESFLRESAVFASEVLKPLENEKLSEPTPYHHQTHPNFGRFSGCRGGGSSDADLGAPESRGMGVIAVFTTLVALVALYPTVQNWSEWSQTQNEISRVQAKIKEVELEIAGENQEGKDSIRAVYQKEIALLTHLRSEARNGFYLKSLFITSLTAISFLPYSFGSCLPASFLGSLST